MRNLTRNEIGKLNNDLFMFEEWMKTNGFFNETVKRKIRQINIHVETGEELKSARGIAHNNRIGLNENIINDDIIRAKTLFHEMAHIIMGQKNCSQEAYNNILGEIINNTQSFQDELKLPPVVYARGVTCLEEFLVEEFAQASFCMTKNVPFPTPQSLKNPSISGDYGYISTYDSNYGIFQSICNELVIKTFGNLPNAIRSSCQEEFFIKFFQVYDNVEIMNILGNLGQILEAITSYAGHSQIGITNSPSTIAKLLRETNILVANIKPLEQEKSRSI